jgi:hypothetical protein
MSDPSSDPKQLRSQATKYLQMRNGFTDSWVRRALEDRARELRERADLLDGLRGARAGETSKARGSPERS